MTKSDRLGQLLLLLQAALSGLRFEEVRDVVNIGEKTRADWSGEWNLEIEQDLRGGRTQKEEGILGGGQNKKNTATKTNSNPTENGRWIKYIWRCLKITFIQF